MPLECFKNDNLFATLTESGGSFSDRETGVYIRYEGDNKPNASITYKNSRGDEKTIKKGLPIVGNWFGVQAHYPKSNGAILVSNFFLEVPEPTELDGVIQISVRRV